MHHITFCFILLFLSVKPLPAVSHMPTPFYLNSPMDRSALMKNSLKYQNNFCANSNQYANQTMDELFHKIHVGVLQTSFEMFAYKKGDTVSSCIHRSGGWEMKELIQVSLGLDRYMRNKGITERSEVTFLDIGAQVGWYTLVVGAKGYNVIGFEPMKENAYMIRKSICINPGKDNTLLIEKALGQYNMECALFSPPDNLGDPALKCNHNIEEEHDNPLYRGKVDVMQLDDFAPLLKNVGAIKIDIEGFEHNVLMGGRKVMLEMHVPYIMSEFSPEMLRQRGGDPYQYLTEFQAAGYKFSRTGFGLNYISLETVMDHAAQEKNINLFITYAG